MALHYTVCGRSVELPVDEDLLVVRFHDPAPRSVRAAAASRALMDDFSARSEVPGEPYTLLRVAPLAQPRERRGAEARARLDALPEVARAGAVFRLGDLHALAVDGVIAGIEAGVDPESLASTAGARLAGRWGGEKAAVLLRLAPAEDPLDAVARIASLPGVRYAEPDFVTLGRHIPRRPRGPAGGRPSRRSPAFLTRGDRARAVQGGDPAIRIAVLDDGVERRHPALAGRIDACYDAIVDDEFQEPHPWERHGTGCARIAAGASACATGPGCSLIAVRVTCSELGGGVWKTSSAAICRALEWCWQRGADVILCAWGGCAPSQAVAEALETARGRGRDGRGCVLVAAAGDDAGPVSFPASLASVLCVSASNEFDEPKTRTSRDGETWWGSCYGPEVDLAAPGVGHRPEAGDPDPDGELNGTAAAAALTSGAAALVLSARPSAGEEEVRAILCRTADRVGSPAYLHGRNDPLGCGRLNALAAVRAAMEQVG